MRIVDRYSFGDGETLLHLHFPEILTEVENIILKIDAENCKLKAPKGDEIQRARRVGTEKFYSPPHLNALFDYFFFKEQSWDIKPRILTNDRSREGFRELDFLKEKVGVEIQFGKYAFLTYDIIAKMIIFKNHGMIQYGIEVCPTASMLPFMSSGIGAFEQVRWDLEHRGFVSGFDVPVLLLGVDSASRPAVATSSQARSRKLSNPIQRQRVRALSDKILGRVQETGIIPE